MIRGSNSYMKSLVVDNCLSEVTIVTSDCHFIGLCKFAYSKPKGQHVLHQPEQNSCDPYGCEWTYHVRIVYFTLPPLGDSEIRQTDHNVTVRQLQLDFLNIEIAAAHLEIISESYV